MTDALELGSDRHLLKQKCLLRKMKSEMPNTLEGSCDAPMWYFENAYANPDGMLAVLTFVFFFGSSIKFRHSTPFSRRFIYFF